MARQKSSHNVILFLAAVILIELLVVLTSLTEPKYLGLSHMYDPEARFRKLGENVVPEYVHILKATGNDALKLMILSILPRLGCDVAPVLPCLFEILERARPGPDEAKIFFEVLKLLPELACQPACAEIIPELISQLEHKDQLSRAGMAADLLIPFGSKASNAVPVLLRVLTSNSSAVLALAAIEPDLPGLPQRLIRMVTSNTIRDDVRLHAIEALGELGPRAADTVPELRSLLNLGLVHESFLLSDRMNSLENRQSVIVTALGRMGPSARSAVPILSAYLTNNSGPLRIFASRALWQITGDAKPLVPVLNRILEEENYCGAHVFTFEFESESQNEIHPILQSWWMPPGDYRWRVQHLTVWGSAVYLLGEMGAESRQALPALNRITPMLGVTATIEDLLSARAVARISGDISEFVDLLLEQLDFDPYTQRSAIHFLAQLGRDAEPALPRLQTLATNQHDGVRTMASRAISRMTNSPKKTMLTN